jgi:hypothetical protein
MSAVLIAALSSWKDFVSALTEAFRPVELSRHYTEQMLSISQGKQDMRSYIASFNALRAKIPGAFPEQTLRHLFLQGCRPDLQRNISLQYPKTLAEYFQHAITLSDLPGQTKPPAGGSKGSGTGKAADSPLEKSMTCDHCKKPGHTQDRCFQSLGNIVLIRKRPNIRGVHAVGSSGSLPPDVCVLQQCTIWNSYLVPARTPSGTPVFLC